MIKIPRGEAPKQVRRQWVGAILDATGPAHPLWESGLLTHEDMPERTGYSVPSGAALQVLGERSPAAADWFKENIRRMPPYLTFGADEVEEIHNEV
ncbi:MAG: hypothetical protein Q8P13_01880 [bacterium]|nr:hypothetical protein [bacterium]